ncbi:uncharacterized protein B0I36DRAFT_369647 [Microdochium trichocladiopsis]|uniref:NACHT domain-containing protein n=1 Tax=Microdochium trichocladiopsis TaxID=1682393 RepID=A0A9P9BHW2_9PEZI|nr:uncharacterized protein B0I36DRAFT_369647 [Microdochium trichocladiopsis]KAH7012490.1 hypothetical protein B0I36DRAFT_369647 [Microdochium trichocladiopsis]
MNIAFVGCGFVAAYYADTLANHPELHPLAAYDIDTTRLSAFSKHYNIPAATSLQEILSNPSIQTIVNLTPPATHHSISRSALLAGKHVYSEKPLAIKPTDAKDLITIASQQNRILAVAPCNFLGRSMQTLARLVTRENAIGIPRVVYAELDDGPIHKLPHHTWSSGAGCSWPAETEFRVGCIWEHAAYEVGFLTSIFGPATSLTSFSHTLVPEKMDAVPAPEVGPDFSVAVLKFRSGVVARLTIGTVSRRNRSMTITGDKGILHVPEVWDFDAPVQFTRARGSEESPESPLLLPAVTTKTTNGTHTNGVSAPSSERGIQIDTPAETPPVYAGGGACKMDMALGLAELAAAIKQGRRPRMGADHAFHVYEVLQALNDSVAAPGYREIKSEFAPIELMPAAKTVTAFAGSGNEPLRCELRPTALDRPPLYEALSYVWGSSADLGDIEVVSQRRGRQQDEHDAPSSPSLRLAITQSVMAILHLLRLQADTRTLWIDQLCINQSDPGEKTAQVQKMCDIYSKCDQCLVYMGAFLQDKRVDAEGAVAVIKYMAAFHPQEGSSTRAAPECMSSRESFQAAMQALGTISTRAGQWWHRAWTLQELIVPKSVKFFSAEGEALGNKTTLEILLHECTGVPVDALRGKPLADFSINERLSWLGKRKTKRPEDLAYCMFGIFDVHMPLIYSEGEEKAFLGLRREIGQDTISEAAKQCIADLRVTDPRHDKRRIESMKGSLLRDSYLWVLDNPDFRQWRNNADQRLRWVKGDPGKGKTMLLCGIIDELERMRTEGQTLSYFLFQATDERINTAKAALRSLIYMLLKKDASIISHMEKPHAAAGRDLFEDTNGWQALCEIFENILQDPKLQGVVLVVDALDECLQDLPVFLDLVVRISRTTRAKWLISSRNWPQIEEPLSEVAHGLSLEVNETSVTEAVNTYIEHKVSELSRRKGYRDDVAKEVYHYLSSNAAGTFLWVALEIISLCGSFLTIREDKAYFVHQAAKDFLTKWHTVVLFPNGQPAVHSRILENSIAAMSSILKRDNYNLHDPGFPIEKVKPPTPDPLSTVRYCCVYWVNHLVDAITDQVESSSARDGGIADSFLRNKALYWIER